MCQDGPHPDVVCIQYIGYLDAVKTDGRRKAMLGQDVVSYGQRELASFRAIELESDVEFTKTPRKCAQLLREEEIETSVDVFGLGSA